MSKSLRDASENVQSTKKAMRFVVTKFDLSLVVDL